MRDPLDFGPPEPPKEFAPCEHGATFACPWPKCRNGVVGVQLVRCGPEGARYFGRALVARDGKVTYEWAERRRRRAKRRWRHNQSPEVGHQPRTASGHTGR